MCVHVRLYILEWRTARSLVHISTYCIVLHLEMYRVAKIVNFFTFQFYPKHSFARSTIRGCFNQIGTAY